MSDTTGLNQTTAGDAINLIISGGADVRLMTSELAYGDTATELDSKEVSGASYSAQSVTEANWTVSFDSTDNTATLTNDAEIDYGEAGEDWGVVVDFAIHNPATDQFIIADEPNNPDITQGENVSFPADAITYTLGATQP